MFTGLIETMGVVERAEPSSSGVRLIVAAPAWSHRATVGESIAVNGCCLTVAADPATTTRLVFDVVPETLAKTTLGALAAGDRVHLEHAATPATLLGGHIVQGHVDGVGRITSVTATGEQRAGSHNPGAEHRLRVEPLAAVMEFIIPKGSITLDGVSLTIAEVDPKGGWFEVALIPTTLAKTTLGERRAGDRCNIECDAMAKTIVYWLKHYRG